MYRRSVTLVLVALAAVLAGAPPPASAQQPKVLRVAFPSEDGSLTPYTFRNGYALMTLVYDTLSWRDAQGVARPWLARSIRRTAGGRQIVATLRRGVRWQDGRPLTAADVAFTYGYMKTHFNPRFTPQLRELAGVRATGRLTVVFSLRAPALGFEDQPLADVPILPQHLWDNLPSGRLAPAGLPVGSGPYRLTRHVAGHSYRFQANAGYFRGRPAVDRIDVPIVPGQGDGLAGLQEDRYDMASVPVPPGTALQTPVTVRYSRADAYAGTVLAFDLTRAPFDQPQARRAVAAALDLPRIAGATSGPGSRTPADRGMLHPRSRWAGTAVLHRADPAAARVALSEQGVGVFTVAASVNDPVRLEAARRVVLALRDVGAQARLEGLSPAALDRAMGADGTTAPTFDAAVVGSPALASYDPAFLRVAFGPPADAPLNDGGYRSARFAQLADAVEQARTPPARRRAVQRELRLLARDLPVLPLFFGGATFAYRPSSYDGWVDVRGSGILDKRSFLAGAAAGRAPSVLATDPVDRTGGGDGQVSLVPFVVALGLIMIAGLGWALWRRRPS
jgi:peptide/nickel transport system substrate-binding protein